MKRSRKKELMDLPGNPPELLQDDLANLKIINRSLGAYRGLFRYLRKNFPPNGSGSFSLLDLGTGAGDIPARLARWSRHTGVHARIVAVDLDPVTLDVARSETQDCPEVSLVRANIFSLPFRAASFDFVHASQVLHHFSEEEIVTLLRSWSAIARHAVLVSDLVRHPLAYYGISALTRLFSQNPMTRNDAPLSVERAFTLDEWRELFRRAGLNRARVTPLLPFRIFADFSLDGSGETI